MKNKLSLLEVCKLPDVQLHSKTAFFKSIVGRQTTQVTQMKDQIASLSYTVKIIGVQGQEVGITSKRVPMKFKKTQKEKEIPLPESQYIPVNNYLPHKSFYAHPLIPIHKQKEANDGTKEEPLLAITPNYPIFVDNSERKVQGLRIRTRSMANMRSLSKKTKHLNHNLQEIGKIQGRRGFSTTKKKSFSHLLKECNAFSSQRIDPLFHEENAMFKKIQKIKGIYPQPTIRHQLRIQRYQSNLQSRSSRSTLKYEEQV